MQTACCCLLSTTHNVDPVTVSRVRSHHSVVTVSDKICYVARFYHKCRARTLQRVYLWLLLHPTQCVDSLFYLLQYECNWSNLFIVNVLPSAHSCSTFTQHVKLISPFSPFAPQFNNASARYITVHGWRNVVIENSTYLFLFSCVLPISPVYK